MSELTPNTMLNFLDFARWVNDLAGGYLFTGVLFAIFMVVFYVAGDKTSDKLMASAVTCSILATLLRAGQLINEQFLLIFWVGAAVSVMYSIWAKE